MLNDETQVDDLEIQSEEEVDTENEESESTDWQAEAKKWKAIAERKAKKAEKQTSVSKDLPNESVERLTLKVDGYNDDEIAKIMELGGLKALSNSLVKKAVDVMREERLTENAQVDIDGATADISRKYSEADLRKMSAEELEKILPKA